MALVCSHTIITMRDKSAGVSRQARIDVHADELYAREVELYEIDLADRGT
jgi:hypothetical protein